MSQRDTDSWLYVTGLTFPTKTSNKLMVWERSLRAPRWAPFCKGWTGRNYRWLFTTTAGVARLTAALVRWLIAGLKLAGRGGPCRQVWKFIHLQKKIVPALKLCGMKKIAEARSKFITKTP